MQAISQNIRGVETRLLGVFRQELACSQRRESCKPPVDPSAHLESCFGIVNPIVASKTLRFLRGISL